jgi:hypothetical protein
MVFLNCKTKIATLAFIALIGLHSTRAVAGDVTDRAEFFSAAAVEKANEGIKAIKELYNRDFVISTFPTVADDRAEMVRKLDKQGRNKFFQSWTRDRIRLEEVKDIYILICKEPAHIQVELGQEVLDKVIPPDDVPQFKDLIVKDFREKKYDQGLIHAVEFARGKFDEHAFRLFPGPTANAVKDYGSFFSPSIVESATGQIRKISPQLKRPIAVDTFKQAPSEKQVQSMSREQRERFFLKWLRERMQSARFEGIYILVSKEPSHVEVGVGPELMKKAFKLSDRESLQKLLLKKFRDHRFDEGLTEALNLIQDRVRSNFGTGAVSTPPAVANTVVPAKPDGAKTGESKKQDIASSETAKQAPATPSGIDQAKKKLSEVVTKGEEKAKQDWEAGPSWIWVLYVILGLLGLWIVIGSLRALFGSKKRPPSYYPPSQPPQATGAYSSPQGPRPMQPSGPTGYGAPPVQPMGPAGGYYPPPPPAGGGGGFMSGLLGGMFGAAAGNWIYDSFSGRSRMGGGSWGDSGAYGSPAHRPVSSSSPVEPRGEISAGGGDFGEPAESSADAGGGDFGEPAEASADAGGGDFGEPAESSADAGGGDFGEPGGQENFGGGDIDAGGGDFGGGDPGGDSGGGDF